MSETETRPVVLELSDLTRHFDSPRGFLRYETLTAVDRVSLQVRRGEILGIVGESGSGKTTLSKMMLGLLAPSAGSVRLDGRPVAAFGRRELARRVQFVFQDPYSSGRPGGKRDRERIGSVLRAVELSWPSRIVAVESRFALRQSAASARTVSRCSIIPRA